MTRNYRPVPGEYVRVPTGLVGETLLTDGDEVWVRFKHHRRVYKIAAVDPYEDPTTLKDIYNLIERKCR